MSFYSVPFPTSPVQQVNLEWKLSQYTTHTFHLIRGSDGTKSVHAESCTRHPSAVPCTTGFSTKACPEALIGPNKVKLFVFSNTPSHIHEGYTVSWAGDQNTNDPLTGHGQNDSHFSAVLEADDTVFMGLQGSQVVPTVTPPCGWRRLLSGWT
jgi:hypothetical protein